ncbi:MAG: U32 family peptidase [Candidatus Cloacimonetes bacterium]|nr:U32 family peptidase [Candidatus Cloacimonadota bacterium]
MSKKNKIELLLPAGHPEMALAAFEGGADAVYAGLDDFNARKKAKNFNYNELFTLIDYAHKINKKVYVTLNTLVKNNEIKKLIDVLLKLEQIKPDALIIQDWGLFYLLKKHFPELPIHASTQLGVHHSNNVKYCAKKGFERVILARELSLDELVSIQKDAETQLEIFVHGALCYSFSGYCLFSSFLGGMSANRGMCKQPCRRLFNLSNEQKYLFSLKDLMLIDFIPKLMEMNIHSLKIEGRLKSLDYVYNTAKAYKMVIDNPKKIDEAKKILQNDLAREKTSYFMGQSVADTFTKTPTVGKLLGRISFVDNNGFQLVLQYDLSINSKLRIITGVDTDTHITDLKKLFLIDDMDELIKIDFAKKGQIVYIQYNKDKTLNPGDEVYLVSNPDLLKYKFSFNKTYSYKSNDSKKNKILKDIKLPSIVSQNQEIYLRVDQPDWLNVLPYDDLDGVLLNFTKKAWEETNGLFDYILQNLDKVIVELPLFIAESNLDWYANQINLLRYKGINKFCLSQLSQKMFFNNIVNNEKSLEYPLIMTNENVYLLNDVAIKYIQEEQIDSYIYPLENDVDNMITGNDRYGIVPVYFYPKLFYSRMPINVKPEDLITDQNNRYRKFIKEGITIITTHNPVSWTQYRDKLLSKGFSRFLLDLSFSYPQNGVVNKLIDDFNNSKILSDTGKFNFKKGLW